MTAVAEQNRINTAAFEEFGDFVEFDHPLARFTWFRVGGPAAVLATPRSVEDLGQIARRCEETKTPVYVLGLGANVLVSDDGIPGCVIRLAAPFWKELSIDENLLTVNGGFEMQKLVLRTCREGLSGMECMAGIPGTVGGGLRMNAGGKYGDFGQNVKSVTVMDANGNVFERTRDDLVFEYRRSNIVAPYILSATFELTPDDPDDCTKRTKEIWMYKNNTQPLSSKSAGCMFKNPIGADKSAGGLIDAAGCKGMRVGNAEVSEKHANFIVAHPGCTAADIANLADVVRGRVQSKTGVLLHSEVRRWPSV